MSEMTEATPVVASPGLPEWVKPLAFAVLPVLAALVAGALVLWALGSDPLNYYTYVVERGLLRSRGLQASIVHMIPLLILGTALIVSFKAGLWNLGIDGQYILGTLTAGIVAPQLVAVMPALPALFLAMLAGAAVGALWGLPPALLRAHHGINEVISGLMMSFMATSLASAIVKLWAKDPASQEPQTFTIPVDQRLPLLPGTDINIGIVIALVLTLVAHFAITRTSAGLKLRILGLNPAAATHAGLPAPRMIVMVLCLSGAIGGFAGAVELTGVLGKMQASWNPAYGFSVVPLVFLARMNGWAMIAFVFAFSVLSIGGASAAVRLGVPQSFTLVLVGFLLLFLALAEWIDQNRREQA